MSGTSWRTKVALNGSSTCAASGSGHCPLTRTRSCGEESSVAKEQTVAGDQAACLRTAPRCRTDELRRESPRRRRAERSRLTSMGSTSEHSDRDRPWTGNMRDDQCVRIAEIAPRGSRFRRQGMEGSRSSSRSSPTGSPPTPRCDAFRHRVDRPRRRISSRHWLSHRICIARLVWFDAYHALSTYMSLDGFDVVHDHSGSLGPRWRPSASRGRRWCIRCTVHGPEPSRRVYQLVKTGSVLSQSARRNAMTMLSCATRHGLQRHRISPLTSTAQRKTTSSSTSGVQTRQGPRPSD